MADHPLAPPPSYEEVVGSASYYPPPNIINGHGDMPPPYSYITPTCPPGPAATSAQGSSQNSQIFVIRPPTQPRANTIDLIPPKPSTPMPPANPNPASNRTPAPNPTPAAPRTTPQNPPQNSNARRQSFENKEIIYGFFRKMYMILFVQCVCALSLGAGTYSNEHIRKEIASNNGMRTAAIVMFIGAMIFTWITTETRKAKKPFCIVFMVIFTMIIGYCIMMLSCVVGSPIPLICVGIIAIVCILTILFLLQKWITFTLISGMLFTVVVVPSLMGISTAIFNPVMDCVNGGIAALIFSWWVMLITWCMVEDRKKNGLQPDQYLAIQPFVFAGVLFLPWILLGIIFCKFEWKKYK